jgi:hypothetical protein
MENAQVVVQMVSDPAMERSAAHSREALPVAAHPADVLPGFDQEDVGSPVHLLRATFEIPGNPGKRGKIEGRFQTEKEIDVFRVFFGRA